MRAALVIVAAALLAACQGAVPAPESQERGPGLRVMTFNIRYGTAKDGENHWKHRKELVADTIRESAPHVLAIQEGLGFQMDYLAEHCPGYLVLGQHRNGGRDGEFSGLLINAAHLEVVDWGQFWLSSTPEVVASRGWDAALARTAVWARLHERGDGAADFIVLGTHFDHRGARAREESARLVVEIMSKLRHGEEGTTGKPLPVILMGDFNARPGTTPMSVFEQAGYVNAVPFMHPEATDGGTFHRFEGYHTGGMIDSIWVTRGWQPMEAEILRPRLDGRSASDHDPVFALLPWAS